MKIDNVTIQNTFCKARSTFRAFTILQKTHKKRLFEYMYIHKFIFCHLPHSVGNLCLGVLFLQNPNKKLSSRVWKYSSFSFELKLILIATSSLI